MKRLFLVAIISLTCCQTIFGQVQFVWSGGVTTNSAVVKAKLTDDSTMARLAVSQNSNLSFPVYSGPDTAITAENNRVIGLEISGLLPNTQYYYGIEVSGNIDSTYIGRFHTFPADTETFTIALGSCAMTNSNHAVFSTIESLNPLFFFHLGDMHYQNIAVNNVNLFRSAFEGILNSANQSSLYRSTAISYIWDDHDYGPNNSDSTAPGRTAARLTYQEYVPHYALSAGTGDVPIYYSFSVGRVRFIVCDSRSARSPFSATDNSSKTMLGTAQKAWFKQELLDAASSHALIVWVNSLPWIGTTGDDGWHGYTTERAELAQFIRDNNINNLCMVSGDAHMLAIDDGTNSYYASGSGTGFPVFHAAALDQGGSIKGGPYSEGTFPGGGQFGLMTVFDYRDSITVLWSGRNSSNQILVSHSFTYPVGVLTDIDEPDNILLPVTFVLKQNFPNPFNPSTTIEFELPVRTYVLLTVYNILGQEVKLLADKSFSAGVHSVNWDGSDSRGVPVPGGVYFYRIIAENFIDTRKMVLVK